MSDRELLELAAKAAGFVINTGRQAERDASINPETAGLWVVDVSTNWNPLKDDGQALRLAVKLDIPISSESVNGTTWICSRELQVYEPHGQDKFAATRRAIVRAAAAIGAAL